MGGWRRAPDAASVFRCVQTTYKVQHNTAPTRRRLRRWIDQSDSPQPSHHQCQLCCAPLPVYLLATDYGVQSVNWKTARRHIMKSANKTSPAIASCGFQVRVPGRPGLAWVMGKAVRCRKSNSPIKPAVRVIASEAVALQNC